MKLGLKVDAIPDALQRRRQWVCWRAETRNGKVTKVPYTPATGAHAKVNDLATWTTFQEAVSALETYDGVGFVLTAEDPFVALDLDKCVDAETGSIEPWAKTIIGELQTYTERSPSGAGLHIFAQGTLPGAVTGKRKGQIEVYASGRYLTLTGHRVEFAPLTIEERSAELAALWPCLFPESVSSPPRSNGTRPSALHDLKDEALIDKACSARNRSFRRLWQGDFSAYPSQSEADAALCAILAFWTQRDAERMDLLFRQSGLFRSKWDERHSSDGRSYGRLTIDHAIALSQEMYEPKQNGVTADAVPDETRPDSDHDHPSDHASALQTLSWREMTNEPSKPIDWHWEGWTAAATVVLLAGAGESLKSWVALYLAIMTAAGRAALAAPASESAAIRQGPVLYVTAENALEEEKRRCSLFKAGLDLPEDLPICFLPAASLSLSNPDQYGAVLKLVKALHPMAIFIDSAIAVSDLESENDNPAVRKFMKTRVLPLAREYAATVFLLVHSPKPSMQPGARLSDEHVARGAGDWRNACDCLLHLRREPSLGEQAVVLRHAKMRVGPRHRPIWFTLEDVVPGQAVRLTYGGTYDDVSGQATAAALVKAIGITVEILRTERTIGVADLTGRLTAGGIAKATSRRAQAVLRGKKPWPFGPYAGKCLAIVTEGKDGRKVILTLDPGLWDQVAAEEG